jgi:membrane protease YdiL (CAAX protease family)
MAAALYAVVVAVAGLVSGVDYDELSDSSSNVVGFVIVPVGLGILATFALTARWGWWHAIFREDGRLTRPRWARLIPAFFVLAIVVTLIVAPWQDWSAGLVVLILLGTMMVGFAEEIVFRGYLLVGARARYSEVGAWFVTSALFGLFHGLNILTGQSVGTTLQQVVFAFILGSGLYLVRRVTGLLAVAMLIHGLWDFSTFIGAGRGEDTGGIPDTVAAAPFTWATMLLTVAALIVLFRRKRLAAAPVT